jgi:hypothetical protein
MDNLLKTFINAIAGIIIMLKQLSDPKGEAHTMSQTTPPQVLHTKIMSLVGVYTAKKGLDIAWMILMDYQIQIISESICLSCRQDAELLALVH